MLYLILTLPFYRLGSITINLDYVNLDTEYDFVAVVDALSRADRQKYGIARPLIEGLGRMGVNQELAEVGNIPSLKVILSRFRIRAESGERFCLHFIAHGNKDGLDLVK